MLSVVVDIITGVPYFPPTSPLHPVLGLEELKQNGKRTAECPVLSWAQCLLQVGTLCRVEEPEVWNRPGFSDRPAGWLPVKSLRSPLSFCRKEKPLKETEESRVGLQDGKEGKWAVTLLGGNFPVGTASRASALKPNGKSLPDLC